MQYLFFKSLNKYCKNLEINKIDRLKSLKMSFRNDVISLKIIRRMSIE